MDDARETQSPYVDAALVPAAGRDFAAGVRRWLRQHLGERYNLAALARAFHVSTRTMLRRAGLLLESTDRTVASIAAEVGYGDPGTFSALFARRTGRRPADYRATFRRPPGGRGRDRHVTALDE